MHDRCFVEYLAIYLALMLSGCTSAPVREGGGHDVAGAGGVGIWSGGAGSSGGSVRASSADQYDADGRGGGTGSGGASTLVGGSTGLGEAGADSGGTIATIVHGEQLTTEMVGPVGLGVNVSQLEAMRTPDRGYFRCDTESEWLVNHPYVYNNDRTNHGGIVPEGGMKIDGVDYPAGTWVVQFRAFTAEFYCASTSAPHILFRGCSFRGAPIDPPGWLNAAHMPPTTGLSLHYCDYGGLGPADAERGGLVSIQGGAGGTILRCYSTYTAGPLQINVSHYDVIENYFDKITFYFGEDGPDGIPGGSDMYHINGVFTNGGERCIRILRNKVFVPSPDEAGHVIGQTDCIALFQDFGDYPGDLQNRDGTLGYQIRDNYVGGGGYSFYAGLNAGKAASTVKNLVLTGNKITTTWWPHGGQFGPITAEPNWASNGNLKTGNVWADGPQAGSLW